MTDLFSKIRDLERKLNKYFKDLKLEVMIFSFGRTDIDPKYLSVWIGPKTDKEKQFLLKDKKLQKEFRTILININYPKEAIKNVDFTVESQETIDRDFDGNWWYAIK